MWPQGLPLNSLLRHDLRGLAHRRVDRIPRWLGRPILNLAPPRPAPRSGRFSNDPPKDAREMWLIAQPAAQRNRGQRLTAREHQALRHLNSSA